MTKRYTNPELLIFSINKSDIIITSPNYNPAAVAGSGQASNYGMGYAPGRNDWMDGE